MVSSLSSAVFLGVLLAEGRIGIREHNLMLTSEENELKKRLGLEDCECVCVCVKETKRNPTKPAAWPTLYIGGLPSASQDESGHEASPLTPRLMLQHEYIRKCRRGGIRKYQMSGVTAPRGAG